MIAHNGGRRRHHYDRADHLQGTLMRHFLRLARAPRALACRVPTRAVVAELIADTGSAHRLAPANPRTFPGAVVVAAVAVSTDTHLLRAASATVQPKALLARPHALRTPHWTTPRRAGIKAMRTRPHARQHAEGPGFFPGMCPGLRLFGVREQDSAAPSAAAGQVQRLRGVAQHHRPPALNQADGARQLNSTRPRSTTMRVRTTR